MWTRLGLLLCVYAIRLAKASTDDQERVDLDDLVVRTGAAIIQTGAAIIQTGAAIMVDQYEEIAIRHPREKKIAFGSGIALGSAIGFQLGRANPRARVSYNQGMPDTAVVYPININCEAAGPHNKRIPDEAAGPHHNSMLDEVAALLWGIAWNPCFHFYLACYIGVATRPTRGRQARRVITTAFDAPLKRVFDHSVVDTDVEQGRIRSVSVLCPAVGMDGVELKKIDIGCVVSIQVSIFQEGNLQRSVQFDLKKLDGYGMFEFVPHRMKLEHGILTFALQAAPCTERIYRFPQHHSMAFTDGDGDYETPEQ